MARARNIKPGFFTNGDLADCSPLARLLFIGLWGICDREGRLVDKPRDIKAKVLPFDECDCDALLGELNKTGFIRRYSTAPQSHFIWVVNFKKHQHIHKDETASQLPEYNDQYLNPEKTGKPPPILNAELLNAEPPNTPTREKPKKETTDEPRYTFTEYLSTKPSLTPWRTFATGHPLNWSNGHVDDAYLTFREYYLHGKGKKIRTTAKGWDARWRTWCRKDGPERGGRSKENVGYAAAGKTVLDAKLREHGLNVGGTSSPDEGFEGNGVVIDVPYGEYVGDEGTA